MAKQVVVGYAGMTHLGINYATATAGKGFKVIGYDKDSQVISDLVNGKSPVLEPGLNEALHKRKALLNFTADMSDLGQCDIVYISTDVSIDDKGASQLAPINNLIDSICKHLNKDALLIVLCQVPTGFTRKINWPQDKLFYQVETLVFGQALMRAEQPERLIVGSRQSPDTLPEKYQELLQAFDCPIVAMNYESAELTKMAINCYLAATVTITNTLAELCEQIGANWAQIVPALQLDKRIGKFAYLKPGLGLSGGNLERDLAYITALACENGTDNTIIRSLQSNSAYRKDWVLRTLHSKVIKNIQSPKIAVWGLTYKENTHSVKNSPAIALINKLNAFCVCAYDPVVKNLDNMPHVRIAETAILALNNADVLVVMTPWQEFAEQDIQEILGDMIGKTIIDPFAMLAKQFKEIKEFNYYTLGN